MRTIHSNRFFMNASRAGFSLLLVLSIMSAVLLLVVAVFSTVRFESMKTSAYDKAFRAELAADAGLQDAMAAISRIVDSDSYVIFNALRPDGSPVLVGAEWDGSGWSIVPMVSGDWQPGSVASLSEVGEAPAADGQVPVLPWMEERGADAVELRNVDGSSDPYTVTRYRYWVEDLQGYLNADAAGNTLAGSDEDGSNEAGTHERSGFPFGAPGLTNVADGSLPLLADVALYLIDPDASGGLDTVATDFDNALVASRGDLRTNESMFHVLSGSLARDADGRLLDERLRAFEENVVVGLPAYNEQPLVPFVQRPTGGGLVYAEAGAPKVNLNRLLADAGADSESAVNAFADQIERQLPDFETGRVGTGSRSFVEDYLRTLAANAIDYADADGASTLKEGVYRGIDSFPLVSELHYRFRWESVVRENNRVYAVMQVTPYVELWNMTNQPVSGTAQISFECGNRVSVGFNSYTFDDPSVVGAADVCTPTPVNLGGLYYCPPFAVELEPNEYQMVAMQTYEFKLDGGPSGTFIPSPLYFEESDTRGYSLMWNGQKVDHSRDGCERNGGSLRYPSGDRQKYRCTIPGHSYGKYGNFANNVGDPRAAYYIDLLQGACAYPHNAASPNRRNIRWDIYRGGVDRIYGRVIPSEWGDGGHDSPLGDVPPGVRSNGNHLYDMIENSVHGDTNVSARFSQGEPVLTEEVKQMAPQRISNLGYFLSETELGHVFDPLPYDQKVGSTNSSGDGFFDIETSDTIDNRYAGGHTLRIGRPAHSRFANNVGTPAWHLLDLFHTGMPLGDSDQRAGNLREIFGHVNLNTASREVLRALAGGALQQDPVAGMVTSEARYGVDKTLTPQELTAPTDQVEADIIADSIIRWREDNGPFVSPSQLSQVRVAGGSEYLFGNKNAWTDKLDKLEWSDAAAEEIFARTYNSATTRSRNFRVYVVGEVLNRATGQVVGRYSKVVNLFADPGVRDISGELQPRESEITVTYESSL